jgi:hypothetical protein
MITIAAGPDDLVSARMPTLAERRALGILAPDVPGTLDQAAGTGRRVVRCALGGDRRQRSTTRRAGTAHERSTITRPKPCEEHPQGATWFDRELCAPPCGMMHTRCRACGYPVDALRAGPTSHKDR